MNNQILNAVHDFDPSYYFLFAQNLNRLFVNIQI